MSRADELKAKPSAECYMVVYDHQQKRIQELEAELDGRVVSWARERYQHVLDAYMKGQGKDGEAVLKAVEETRRNPLGSMFD